MKLSIVTAVLNSPEVVRRHILHYKNMPLPDDVEWILVDDKSDPPLLKLQEEFPEDYTLPNLKIYRHDRPGIWTQPAARNFGAKRATGDKLLCTDIDHILTKELIDFALTTEYDFCKLKREVAVLNEEGKFIQTEEEVFKYGFEKSRFASRGFRIAPHTNSFIVTREVYLAVGGVSERRVHLGKHPNREEIPFRARIWALQKEGKITVLDEGKDGAPDNRPYVHMFPNGAYCGEINFNPFGLFHNLPRRTRNNKTDP